MHQSVMDWVHATIREDDVFGRRVVEAGAYNVNGSVRPFIMSMSPMVYIGTDMRDGPGVDLAIDAGSLDIMLGHGYADLVISTEMLEHVVSWQDAMNGMICVLAENGVLAITTRGPGFPLHGYPDDHWRYTCEQLGEVVSSAGLITEDIRKDPEAPGVFLRARKPWLWRYPGDCRDRWNGITMMKMEKTS